MSTRVIGMVSFLRYLENVGFDISLNHAYSSENLCNWIASRKIKEKARRCETNKDKDKRLYIKPISYKSPSAGVIYNSVTIEIIGEVDGVWYNLQAYSLSPEEVQEKLDIIEAQLVKAWNSLKA